MSVEWLVTSPNPKTAGIGVDAGQRGWKLHLVQAGQRTGDRKNYYLPRCPTQTLDVSPALCGIVPRHGWGHDLFIYDVCQRCDSIAEKRGIKTPKVPD